MGIGNDLGTVGTPGFLPGDWAAALDPFVSDSAWTQVRDFDSSERGRSTVFPPADQVFRALELAPFDSVRVVILGQDPYHRAGQAHGLAFSVASGPRTPSMRTIRRAFDNDPAVAPPPTDNLEGWAGQGVLLLNTVLTVAEGDPRSHRGHGWEEVTDGVIDALNTKSNRVVFLLWGGDAHKKERRISNDLHVVLKAAHPAARKSAKMPLDASLSFSRANEALCEAGLQPVNWSAEADGVHV